MEKRVDYLNALLGPQTRRELLKRARLAAALGSSGLLDALLSACGGGSPSTSGSASPIPKDATTMRHYLEVAQSMTDPTQKAQAIVVSNPDIAKNLGGHGGLFMKEDRSLVVVTIDHVLKEISGSSGIYIPGVSKDGTMTVVSNWTELHKYTDIDGKPDAMMSAPVPPELITPLDNAIAAGTIIPLIPRPGLDLPGTTVTVPSTYAPGGLVDTLTLQKPDNNGVLSITLSGSDVACPGYSGEAFVFQGTNECGGFVIRETEAPGNACITAGGVNRILVVFLPASFR